MSESVSQLKLLFPKQRKNKEQGVAPNPAAPHP